MNIDNKFLLYGLFDPRNGELRYIGITTMSLGRGSAITAVARGKRNKHRGHIFRFVDL